jgi:hypothetical protein
MRAHAASCDPASIHPFIHPCCFHPTHASIHNPAAVLDLVYMKARKVDTDDAAYVAALLFALPGVREVQPGVPAMGISIDVLGFFWNMILTAMAGEKGGHDVQCVWLV